VVITGGAGFLGRRLGVRLRGDGHEVAALDTVPADGITVGDVTDAAFLASAITPDTNAIVHLASMVSAECEERFDDAIAVNIAGTMTVLDACRAITPAPRLVFASSVAVFGPGPVDDTTRPLPRSTYGMTKAVGELLVNDATRKGFVDGRVARLPTVIIRLGAPNAAASGFASGLFREPLAGIDAVVPVALDTPMVLIGARVAVDGLAALVTLDGDALGDDRVVNLPALEVTVADMLAALERTGLATGTVTVAPEPAVAAVVGTWPGRWRAERAGALGLPADESLDAVLGEYLADVGHPTAARSAR
jgi:nucleoside-diphosphate-sugar epimerase